jgi:hypothetical protein
MDSLSENGNVVILSENTATAASVNIGIEQTVFPVEKISTVNHVESMTNAENPNPVIPPDQPAPSIPPEVPIPQIPPDVPPQPVPPTPAPPTPPTPPTPLIPQADSILEANSKPKEGKQFLNEKFGEQNKKNDIASKLQGQAIKSIAGSIGINDKFFYIRELFAGNAESFRLTMEELDIARNFNEAYSLLLDKFQWDMESEPVQMLLNLIRRKFITSGNE